MKTKLFSLILACILALLPNAMRAQQGYVELKVNNNKAFDDTDATYDLTFKWGTKPSSDLTGTVNDVAGVVIGKYYDLNGKNNLPGWVSTNTGIENNYWTVSQYTYSPRITSATLESDFTTNARPVSCRYWFAGCTQLTQINGIENLNTSDVENMRCMFCLCKSLVSLDVSHFNTSKVTDIDCMFYYCSSLTSIYLKNFDVSQVTRFAELFNNCQSLTFLDISTWTFKKAERLYKVFSNLRNIEILDISNLDTKSTITMDRMFEDCWKLKTIYVGSNWSTAKITQDPTLDTDGQYHGGCINMFNNCSKLVGGAGTTYKNLANAINAAGGSTAAEKATANSSVSKTYARPDNLSDPNNLQPGLLTSSKSFAVIHDDGNGNVTLYILNTGASQVQPTSFTPDGGSEITSGLTIIDNLSSSLDHKWDLNYLLTNEGNIDLSTITSVVIEGSFATQRPTTLASWFSGMSGVTTISGMDYINTTACTSMANMFNGCTHLNTFIYHPTNSTISLNAFDVTAGLMPQAFKTSKVTNMSGMFEGCAALTTINLATSNFSTVNVTNMANMFKGCSSLQYQTYTDDGDATNDVAFNIDLFNTMKVTNMSGMFQGCAGFTGTFNLNRLYTAAVTDMSNMFNGCAGITELQIGGFSLSHVTDITGMFANCGNLVTIKAAPSWNVDVQNVTTKADVFTNSEKLEGGNGTKYTTIASSDPTDYAQGKYAWLDDDATPGYLTEMYPVVMELYDNIDNSSVIAASDGNKVNTVRVHRTFTTGKWTTLCLPFDLTATQVTNIFGISSGDLKVLSGYSTSALTFENATTIEAGKAYLIKPGRVPTFKDDNNNTVNGFAVQSRIINSKIKGTTKNGLVFKGNYVSQILPTTDRYVLKANQASLGGTLAAATQAPSTENEFPAFSAYFEDLKYEDFELTVSDAGVATLYLPYAVVIPDDDYFVAATVNDVVANLGNEYTATARLRRIKGGIIPANTGVIINANPGTYTLCVTAEETSEDIGTNWLHGVLEDTPLAALEYEEGLSFSGIDDKNPDEGEYAIFFAQKGKSKNIGFFYNTAYNFSTHYNEYGMDVYPAKWALANKAFLRVSTSSGLANVRYIDGVFGGADNTTGIEDVQSPSKDNDAIYNLNGQRVTAPAKGIYIMNGKKVFVK